MKRTVAVLSFVLALNLGQSLLLAQGQSGDHRRVVVPDSSVEHPGDRGNKAHTNHLILVSPAGQQLQPVGETPSSLACVYNLVSKLVPGCPIATSKFNASGGSGIIAIVGAFDYPTAYDDLSTFSKQFGLHVLPQCTKNRNTACFQKIYAGGTQPPLDCGWAQESAVGIEWAHAMAPGASIFLVEAASNNLLDLIAAVDVANSFVNPAGAAVGTGLGQVSMSWGTPESAGESINDSHFQTPGIVYVAASGGVGGSTVYPGVSPFVVSAGGTSITRNAGNFFSETAYGASGGGSSLFEPIPGFQSVISGIAGSQRAVPDVSFDADPNSGVAVYDSTPCVVGTQTQVGWQVFGGTSVAASSFAGIINLAGSNYNSTDTELNTIYSCYATPSCYSANFRDITSGSAGSFNATTGWDFVTGVGSSLGIASK